MWRQRRGDQSPEFQPNFQLQEISKNKNNRDDSLTELSLIAAYVWCEDVSRDAETQFTKNMKMAYCAWQDRGSIKKITLYFY